MTKLQAQQQCPGPQSSADSHSNPHPTDVVEDDEEPVLEVVVTVEDEVVTDVVVDDVVVVQGGQGLANGLLPKSNLITAASAPSQSSSQSKSPSHTSCC
jgi:hypothetical protein